MKTGEELALIAMKKELALLSKMAEKAKAECAEYLGTAKEMIEIYRELGEIIKLKVSNESIKKLDALKAREKRVNDVHKKDFLKLCDNEHESEWEKNSLAQEINNIEFRMSLRNRP